jgi:3-methyladenine DNA glycosylase AlkD
MDSTTLESLRHDLHARASSARAVASARFFKTAPGQYGHGDVFLGVTVPQVRTVAKKYRELPFSGIAALLGSDVHEERLCALLILVGQFERGDVSERRDVRRFYLKHLGRVNNWDLVDISADRILGRHMLETHDPGGRLVRLAKSKNVWERRVAILSTFAYIKEGRHLPTFNVARILLEDPHDLIQKAVGWMLREVGKRIDRDLEEEFLKRYYRKMPRTMLRYAIERFPGRIRKAYLAGTV